MYDVNAFERQVADEALRMAGPSEPVDDAAIFTAITATQSPKWRFQSMFSATKFVVAGAIVALFGGFLLAGVLTQPSDEQLPAVGASATATAQAERTEATPSEPEPTAEAEADASTTTANLLPGVDLVAEEVSPGIFRVLGDGRNDLSENIWHVAAAADGDVWVERHAMQDFGDDIRSADSRVFRLGHPEEYVLSRYPDLESEDQEVSFSVTRDGLVVVGDPDTRQGVLTFDGEGWTSAEGCTNVAHFGGFTGPDGGCWFTPPDGTVVMGLSGTDPDADDRDRQYEAPEELDMVPSTSGLGWEPAPWFQIARSGDGTIWVSGDIPGTPQAQFSGFDGEEWKRIPPMEPIDGLAASDNGHVAVAGGPGATLWASHWDPSRQALHVWHWDGAGWTAFGPIETSAGQAWTSDHYAWGAPRSGIHVSDDGMVWFDGLVRYDGESFEAFDLPASAATTDPRAYSVSHGPDGSLWLTVVDDAPTDQSLCNEEGWCAPASDGLYVITPEAVAGTE